MRYHLSKEDFYTQKAKEENYPARSVYKLQEIDRKFGLLKQGDKVLDLGAAPGSWLLYISRRVGPQGRVIGCDTEELKIELPANATFIRQSVFEDFNRPLGSGSLFDVVLSDLAPQTSGLHEKDVALCLELAGRAFEIARQTLRPNGSFAVKLFEGEGVEDYIKQVEQSFEIVKRYRPRATRKGSREIYLVAKNYERQSTTGNNLVVE